MRPYEYLFNIEVSTMAYWKKWLKILLEREKKQKEDLLARRRQNREEGSIDPYCDDEGDQFGPWTTTDVVEPQKYILDLR